MNQTALIPAPGTDLIPDGWAKQTAWPWIQEQTEEAILHDSGGQLAGLEAAYRAVGINTLELTRARRLVEVRWGEVLGPAIEGRPSGNLDRDPSFLNPDQRRVFRRLAEQKGRVVDIIFTATDADDLARAAILRALNGAHVGHNSGENEWYTPAEYIAAARDVMGGIDLDPASTEEANAIIGATTFYTEADNGLTQPWAGRVWMNPPYARPLIDDFCARLAETFASGDVTEACVLVNNATDTGWFHALAIAATAICFPRGRVKFWHPNRDAAAPLQGQAVLYLGAKAQTFRDRFNEFGFTVAL